MTHALRQFAFLSEFSCLGGDCPDTCCKGWNMQLDAGMRERYAARAPELLTAVAEAEGGFIMRRDPATDYCVKFEDGLCGIHKTRGADFLGDACHFYPRVTRTLGAQALMTATPSCPEIARLALFGDDPFRPVAVQAERLPYSLKDYLPEGLTPEHALAVHDAFLRAAGEEGSAEENFLRIASVARSLERLPLASWAEAVPFYLKTAAARLPPAQFAPEDPFNLLHALCGLAVASRKAVSPRLAETIGAMERALGATLDWQQVAITLQDDSLARYDTLRAQWRGAESEHAPPLKRWLQLQLSVALFPFSGLGGTLTERITIIGVRFVTLRLALLCERGISNAPLPQDVVVRSSQSLARVLDHLADPSFSLEVYQEVGWLQESRMHGLMLS